MELTQLFTQGLNAESVYMPDERRRARVVVAKALREIAKKEERAMGQRIRWAAGRIEMGIHPGKKVLDQIGNKRLDAAEKEFLKNEKTN